MRSHCARSRALRLAAALVLLVAVHALDVPLVMRQTTVGDSHGGSGFTVQPLVQKGEPPCTVIIMHGMGTDGEEWAYLALTISYLSLNYVKFVVPSAPVEFITYLNVTAPSWFDIPKLAIDEDVNKRDLLESVERVHNIVKGEIAQGVDPSRIFLVGFSQGGALALSAFLRAPFELAGCVGVATWLPLDREYPRMLSDQARGKDMLIMHVRSLRLSLLFSMVFALVLLQCLLTGCFLCPFLHFFTLRCSPCRVRKTRQWISRLRSAL